MSITHHADNATLLSFSAGTLSEALSAVVAGHLAMCPKCRLEVQTMDRIGGVMLSVLPGTPLVTLPLRAPVLTQVAIEDSDDASSASERGGDIPWPLSRIAGRDLSRIQWKRLGLGVWHLPLTLSPGSKGDLRLIKVGPGQAIPEHGHGGSELSLILAGSYTDEIGRFSVGDLADLDDEIEHRPIADNDLGCICLIASEEKAHFKSILARIVQPFVGL